MTPPQRHEQGAPTGLGMASKEWELAHKEARRAEYAEAVAGRTSGRAQTARLRAAETHRRAQALHERIAALHLSTLFLKRRRGEPPVVGLLVDPAEHDLRL